MARFGVLPLCKAAANHAAVNTNGLFPALVNMVKEVKVKTPTGHIALKVWGDQRQPLVVCVHGFMENAASFDSLIPHLPNYLCYAAIDFPGHGQSSHIPPGFIYTDPCYVDAIDRVRRHFGVDQIGIIGHSMGAGISTLYTHSHQKKTDFFVALDFVGYPSNCMQERIMNLGRRMDKVMMQEGMWEKEKPRTWIQLVGGMTKAWGGSISVAEAEVLLTRSTRPVPEHDLYKLTRDVKIQNNQLFGVSNQVQFMPHPDMSVCLLEADRGIRFGGAELRQRRVEELVRNHRYVEHHMLSGNHHFFHERPNFVGYHISEFLRTHYHLKNTRS